MLDYKDLQEKRKPIRRWPLLIILTGLVAGAALLFFLLQPENRVEEGQSFRVTLDGTAMEPTLPRGSSLLFAPRQAYNRGDIVWLNDPQTGPNARHVRRIVAVAGDNLQLKNNTLYLNGSAASEPYVSDKRSVADYGPLVIPAGQIFVMGDNRSNSQDSRQWGPVSIKLVRGALVTP